MPPPISEIISRAGVRVDCGICGEEIINEREIIREDMNLCKSCAGVSYYRVVPRHESAILWLAFDCQDTVV